MPVVKLDSAIFGAFENVQTLPEHRLDYPDELDILVTGEFVSDLVPVQLSSSLIRLRVDMGRNWSSSEVHTYEMRLEGSGIGPVSSLNALLDAINNGFATGGLSRFTVLHMTETGGSPTWTEVMSLSMTASGYVLASGNQSLTLDGTLPLSFEQIYDLVDLFGQVMAIDSLTRAEREALFSDLSAYGIQGLTAKDGSTVVFGLHVDATEASMTIGGLTFALTGTFPDNFGEDLNLLWDAARIFRNTGDLGAVADFLAAEFAITRLKVTTASGRVLGQIVNPLDGSEMVWKVDGVVRDEIRMGESWADHMLGGSGSINSVLAGMAGHDLIEGFRGSDHLLGGSGRDTLNGGAGDDLLAGGKNNDLLIGDTGADVFDFDRSGGLDRIADFEIGIDRIHIAGVNGLNRLTFTQVGADVLIEFRKLDIIVEDSTVAAIAVADNFLF